MTQLILALDVPERRRAIEICRSLQGLVPWCKIGMEMFTACGPGLVAETRGMGYRIFLDLKFYDIPHTVGRAVASAARIGADLVTLHCQGGERMLREARAAADACAADGLAAPLLFGVTALTSFAPGEMPGIAAPPSEFAAELAGIAAACGLDGVVCSAREAPEIKRRHARLACLCPGIRPAWAAADDQRRITTPSAAVAAGADYLVVGRPILRADDPRKAAALVMEEMAAAGEKKI